MLSPSAAPNAAPTAAGVDISEQLQQLAALRDQGILTPTEFDAKKAELLSQLKADLSRHTHGKPPAAAILEGQPGRACSRSGPRTSSTPALLLLTGFPGE